MKKLLALILLLATTNVHAYGTNGCDNQADLLAHFTGTNGGTTTSDANCKGTGAKTLTANDNASLAIATPKFFTYATLDGTNDYYSVADNASWAFGSGNFTIEGWFRWATDPNAANGGIFGQAVDTNNRIVFDNTNNLGQTGFEFAVLSAGSVVCYYEFYTSLSINTWYHIAWVRSGTNVYLFINGQSQTLNTITAISTSSLPDLAATFDIGRSFFNGGQQYFNGQIDEFRVSKGIARWTANFTPPGTPYCQGCEMMGVLQ